MATPTRDATQNDGRSPPTYYCHRCVRNFTNITPDYTCPTCNSGFVELVENNRTNNESIGSLNESDLFNTSGSNPTNVSEFHGDLNALLTAMAPLLNFGQQPTTSTASATGGPGQAQHPIGPEQTPWGGFLQNLLQGLTNNGAFQVQFQINNSDGRAAAFAFPTLHGNAADYAWGPGGLDEIVTRLLNQVQGGAPPLSREKIDKLPETAIVKEQVDKRLQCAVCMDEFKLAELVRKLACEHLFHKDCIVPWLERHNSCPVCRKCAETGQAPPESPGGNYGGPSGGGGSLFTQNTPASAEQHPLWRDIDELD